MTKSLPLTGRRAIRARFLARQLAEEMREKQYTPDLDRQIKTQKAFHCSLARERACFTGNRWGKTLAGLMEARWHATGLYPDWYPKEGRSPLPSRGRIVTVDEDNGINKIILPLIRKWFLATDFKGGSLENAYNAKGKVLKVRNKHKSFSTIEIMTFRQDITAFGGVPLHWVWIDEHGDREDCIDKYKECKMRLVETNGRLWLTLTPIEGCTWEYTEIFEKQHIKPKSQLEIFRGATIDNPLISQEAIDDLTDNLSRDEKRIRLYGDFVELTGLVYAEQLVPEVHFIPADSIEIEKHWPRWDIIDPHDDTPSAIGRLAVSPDNLIIFYREGWVSGTIDEICDVWRGIDDDASTHMRLIDPNAAGRRYNIWEMGLTMAAEFGKRGFPCAFANDDIEAGHKKVREYLKFDKSRPVGRDNHPRMAITDNCPVMQYQLSHYTYDSLKTGKNKHFPDVIRYGLMGEPRYFRIKQDKRPEWLKKQEEERKRGIAELF